MRYLCSSIFGMSKKALLALLIAVLLPVVSYLFVKGYSDGAVKMPPRFYPDAINEEVKDGKKISDTIWHQVGNINLTNQLGAKVSLDSIKDKVIVMDFFFTHCPSICPYMTKNMRRLQDMMHSTDPRKIVDSSIVQLISISIDPKRDTVAALKAYADKHGVDHERWWMLTGNIDSIYDFGVHEMRLGAIDGNGVDTLFEHSPKFVLLDKDHVIRGYYNGMDTAQILKLSQDIVFLSLEKDKKKPSAIFQQLKQLWPIFVIVLVLVGALLFFSSRSKNIIK